MLRNSRLSRVPSAIACVLVLGVVGAVAQDAPAPLLSHSFEETDGGWQSPVGSGVISLTHDASSVKSGKGALQFAYSLKKGDFSLMMLSTPDTQWSKAKSVRFWVKADHSTPLAVVLQEQDAGRYTAIFSVPKDTWQQIELSTDDFILDRGKDAPKDPDGKLDLDEVKAISIADMAQIFVQGEPAVATLLGITEGPRKFYLDDFTLNTTALPAAATAKNGEGTIDNFVRPQIGWIALGEVTVGRAAGKPLDGAGLQAKYHQSPSRVCGFLRYLPPDALTGATKLTLSAASLKPAKIVVQLEESTGGKYNTTIELPGNSGRADLAINISDFKEAMDSHDDNGKLDLNKVNQILFMDATGLLDQTDADNTFWLNNVKAVK